MPLFHVITGAAIKCLWVAWLGFWIVIRFWNKPTAYRQPWSRRLPYVLALVCGCGGMLFIPPLRVPLLPVTLAGDIAGLALCVLGLGWAVWARLVLGRNWSAQVTLKENHELIERGPYRITRHPIYTGLTAAFAGAMLSLSPTAFGAIMLMLLAAMLINKLRLEEALLREQFPQTYPAYQTRVRAALVPFIW